MRNRKPSILIKDIINSIDHIEKYVSDQSKEAFFSNYMAFEACLYNIQVIGEAVTKLPVHVKDEESHIPWKLIKGMRNRLIHEYFGTDTDMVWNVIKEDLPGFKSELKKIHIKLINQGS